MMNEIIVGTAIIIIVVFLIFFCPVIIMAGLGTILFGLFAYLIGATVRECMPRYRGM